MEFDTDTDERAPGGSGVGLPASTRWVSVVTILLAVLAVFFLIQWQSSKGAVADLREEVAELEGVEGEVRGELEGSERSLGQLERQVRVLEPGRFDFCNRSTESVTIKGLTSSYLTEDNTIRTFASSRLRTPWSTVEAGERQPLRATGWDGEVTFYSLWLEVSGQDFVLSGTWPPEGDPSCVSWPPAE